MLKNLFVNGRKFPVAIPLNSISDLVAWIEQAILKPRQVITRFDLNEATLDLDLPQEWMKKSLASADRVEIKIEYPEELCFQLLETIEHLIQICLDSIKHLAVRLWQEDNRVLDCERFESDAELISSLLKNVQEFKVIVEAENLQSLSYLIQDILKKLDEAKSHSDNKQYAKILLNQLEPFLMVLKEDILKMQTMCLGEESHRVLLNFSRGEANK